MKYSMLLSTIGKRETMHRALNSFQSFLIRADIELVIATTDLDLRLEGLGRVVYVKKPGKLHFWINASRTSIRVTLMFLIDILRRRYIDKMGARGDPISRVIRRLIFGLWVRQTLYSVCAKEAGGPSVVDASKATSGS